MKLGIIAPPVEESFAAAQKKGLDFLEFCINPNHDAEAFLGSVSQIKGWIQKYRVTVQSVGRWKSERICRDGSLNEAELELSYRLIDAAGQLGCPNFVCGCNYVDELSYYQNCTSAIGYLSRMLDHARGKGIQVLTYNCPKGTFIHNPMAWTLIHGHLKELGIKYDPAHSRFSGADYLKEAADWGDRIGHVHLKGSLMVNGQRFDDPPAGMDQTDWKSILCILRARNYTGGLSIEPHSKVWTGELGDQGVEYTIRYMKELLFRA